MEILVTGGAGYLGSVLVQVLRDKDSVSEEFAEASLTVVDSLIYGQTPGFINTALGGTGGVTFKQADVRDVATMRPLYQKADIIFPLAAIVGYPACDRAREECHSTNTSAIAKMLCHTSDDARIVYPMTNSGYGMAGEEVCTEETPLTPTSEYGTSKCLGERLALDNGAASLRFATLYGYSPRMRWDLMVNDFAWKALSDRYIGVYQPNARRNFLHVRLAAYALITAADLHLTGIYNVGDPGLNMTKMELATRIADRFKAKVIEVDGNDPDKRDYFVSTEKWDRATGFTYWGGDKLGYEELRQAYEMTPRRLVNRNA